MLELLDYPNAEGLHPNEARWRDFGRALLGKPSHQTLLAERTKPSYEEDGLAMILEIGMFMIQSPCLGLSSISNSRYEAVMPSLVLPS